MLIDCDTCPVRGQACHDCVVGLFFAEPSEDAGAGGGAAPGPIGGGAGSGPNGDGASGSAGHRLASGSAGRGLASGSAGGVVGGAERSRIDGAEADRRAIAALRAAGFRVTVLHGDPPVPAQRRLRLIATRRRGGFAA